MSALLKSKLDSFPFIDFEDLNSVIFNVIQMKDGMLNLSIELHNIDTENPEFPSEYGFTIRTTIFVDTLIKCAKSVEAFLDLGMFDNLVFLPESMCLDIDGETIYEFSWDDYLLNDNVQLN
jgi:hypothetical protein